MKESFTIIGEIAKVLLVPIMGIASFFLVRLIKQVDQLTLLVNRIESSMTGADERVKNMQENCHEKHDEIKKTLEDHTKRINKLEVKTATL